MSLLKVTRWSVRFLDNVIDATPYHFEENERNQKKERRIGLGTMGLAELMIKLEIRYGSPESLVFLDKLYGFMAKEAYLASTEIAAEKGSFQAFEADKYVQSGFMKNLISAYPEIGDAVTKHGMRNVTVITQAPTGSTGTMVGTSTGIEPYFAFEYYRQSRLGFDKQYVPIAQEWKDAESRRGAAGLLCHFDELVSGGSYSRASCYSAVGGQLDLEDGKLSGMILPSRRRRGCMSLPSSSAAKELRSIVMAVGMYRCCRTKKEETAETAPDHADTGLIEERVQAESVKASTDELKQLKRW